jgi:hypothetical protein
VFKQVQVPAGGQQSVQVAAGSRVTPPPLSSGDGGGTQQMTASKDIRGPSPEFPQLCEYGLRHPNKGEPSAPVRADQVATAMAFLAQFRPTKRGTYSSYYLKHAAERWGGRNGLSGYVSNGALIAAAFCLGLVIDEYLSCFPTSPNAKIGISKRDYVKLVGY